MRQRRPKNTLNRRNCPPDLIEQARANLGHPGDPSIVTDALFDAAFRSLKSVPFDHPARWAMIVGYYDKLNALYEAITGAASGEAGSHLIAHRPERDHRTEIVPGLQYTTSTNAKPHR